MLVERLFKDGMNELDYYNDPAFQKYQGQWALPNCTAYACGRAQEVAQACFKNEIVEDNAKFWWRDSTWVHQDKPVPGGIVCFTNEGMGHVAICERLIEEENGSYTIVMTDSALESQKSYDLPNYFRLRTTTLKVGCKPTDWGDYTYQGCLVNPHVVDKRTTRNEYKNQLEVVKERLRVRIGPGSTYTNNGQFACVGIYDVIETKKVDDTIWCKLDDNQWCAVAEGYSIFYESTYTDELTKRVANLETKSSAIVDTTAQLANRVANVEDKLQKIANILKEV